MIDKLVFRRFSDAEEIIAELISFGAEYPELREVEENSEDADLALDGCLSVASNDECDYFTLLYVKTRDGKYLITEANYWNDEINN